MFKIDPRNIVVEPGFNCRDFSAPDNIEHVAALKASIKRVGLREPLTVRLENDIVYLVGGECRLRAVLSIIEDGEEFASVPCQADPSSNNTDDRLIEQPTRNGGKKFSQMEMAALAKRLVVGRGLEPEKLAEQWEMTPQNLRRLLDLNALPEAVKETVRAKEIAPSEAARIIAAEGPAAGAEIISRGVALAKYSGKKKATPKQLNTVRSKPIGKTIRPPEAERVIQFLSEIALADSLDAVKSDASRLLMRILES